MMLIYKLQEVEAGHATQNQNQNSLLVTRQMTLFHQGVRMGGGGVEISHLNARVKRTWTHNQLTFQQ